MLSKAEAKVAAEVTRVARRANSIMVNHLKSTVGCTFLPSHLPIFLSPCLPTHLPPCLPVYLPPCLPVFLPTYIHTSLCAYLCHMSMTQASRPAALRPTQWLRRRMGGIRACGEGCCGNICHGQDRGCLNNDILVIFNYKLLQIVNLIKRHSIPSSYMKDSPRQVCRMSNKIK